MGMITGKTVIVTGGGKATLKDGSAGSIGYGIDIAFAKEGANLVITGRNVAKLEAAKESLEAEYGIKVLPVQADVSAGQDNEAVVQHVVDEAIAAFGRIDALVNNAQASASGVTIADHSMEQFDLAIYSGLYATFLYMQKCYPHLKETRGSVVNFASGAGLFGNFGQCSYAAAKEGVRGLTRVRRQRMGPGWHQRQHRLPACLDRTAQKLPERLSGSLRGQHPYASRWPLWQRRDRDRPRCRPALRTGLQVHERRDRHP